MTIKKRIDLTISYFLKNNQSAETELTYRNPFELMVAVILSAQCTDKRVNMITPPLLGKFPDAETMAKAEPEEIFEYIKSCTYPNNKAKHLSGMSRMLVNEFGGIMPSDPLLLQQLPGVGRKTANVIASVVFQKAGYGCGYPCFQSIKQDWPCKKCQDTTEVWKISSHFISLMILFIRHTTGCCFTDDMYARQDRHSAASADLQISANTIMKK